MKIKGFKDGILKNPFVYVIFVFLVSYAGVFVRRHQANRPDQAPIQRAAMRINARYAVPDEQNGAILYSEAIERMADEEAPEGLFETYVWDEQEHADWSWWLEQNREALSLALEAARRTDVYFRLDESDWLPEPDVGCRQPRYLSWTLCAAAGRAAGKAQISEAMPYLDSAFLLGTHFSKSTEFAVVSGLGCRNDAIRTLRAILAQPDLSQSDIQLALDKLQQWSGIPYMDKEAPGSHLPAGGRLDA